jgi:signal transduction histidine kinase
LFIGAGILGLCSGFLVSRFADLPPHYNLGLIYLPSLLAVASGLGVQRFVNEVGFRPWIVHTLLVLAAGMIGVGTYAAGPTIAPFAAMFFIWLALVAWALLEWRAALAHLALSGAVFGWLLVILKPSSAPGARWILLIGTCLTTGVVVDRLVRALTSIAESEAHTRAEIERTAALLDEASRHKSEFLASMSHELRTPLNAVIGFSDVLLTQHFGELNDDQRGYVDDIRSSGAHLLELINDVLDLSKVEAGRLDIESRWFALGDTVVSAANLLRPRAAAAQLELGFDVSPDAAEAFGDERRIKQVLVNLLTNAVKFTPPGGSVDVVARRQDHCVVVAVSDTGVGIAPEDQTRVFDDFHQVGESALAQEGSGLGLALAKRFLDLHGGEIWVESTPGEGSTFSFRLPLPA